MDVRVMCGVVVLIDIVGTNIVPMGMCRPGIEGRRDGVVVW